MQGAPFTAGPPPAPMRLGGGGDLPRGLVYEPTGRGPGTGKAFHVLFGFVSVSDADMESRMMEIDHLGDDVAALRAAGYRVVVDLHADLRALDLALCGEHPDAAGAETAGVLWSGHGNEDGTIRDHEARRIAPEQISDIVARKGTVRLFVMSACWAGRHAERWRRVLGPQAVVIGWSAPITSEKAVRFLSTDEATTKDFDDLLARHLGAPRVADDRSLVEVRALAEAHVRRLPALWSSYDDLTARAGRWLDVEGARGKRGETYFTLLVGRAGEGPPRSQTVKVLPHDPRAENILICSQVGAYSDALDLAHGLRLLARADRARMVLVRSGSGPDASDVVAVEALLLRRGLDHLALGRAIREVGAMADALEHLFFGTDRR